MEKCISDKKIWQVIVFASLQVFCRRRNTKKKLPKRQAMFVQRHTEARSRDHCYQGKAISIKYYNCVQVSVFLPSLSSVQILFSLSRVKLQSATCLEIPYFPTLSNKQHVSRKKLLNIESVLIFFTNFI
jgi:precorrin-6B methylase 1